MTLRDLIIHELEFIKKHIEEYQVKAKEAQTLTMQVYYEGLVVALDTMKNKLEFDLGLTEEGEQL